MFGWAAEAGADGGGGGGAAAGGEDVERNSSGMDASPTPLLVSDTTASVALESSESDANESSTFDMGELCAALKIAFRSSGVEGGCVVLVGAAGAGTLEGAGPPLRKNV